MNYQCRTHGYVFNLQRAVMLFFGNDTQEFDLRYFFSDWEPQPIAAALQP
jgi:hypothetical protein